MNSTIKAAYIAAGSTRVSTKELRKYSVSESSLVRRRVAENTKTPKKVLDKMSLDNDSQVRIAVGLNASTSVDTVSRLVYDDDPDVRYWLASASYLPLRFLRELIEDLNPYVAQRAEQTFNRIQSQVPQNELTVFEFLSQDHSLLIGRLNKLVKEYSFEHDNGNFDETINTFQKLSKHFDSQHKFCLECISSDDGIPCSLLAKCLGDRELIITKMDFLITMHSQGMSEGDFCLGISKLLKLVVGHVEFTEKRLFVELNNRVTKNHLHEMNLRVEKSLLTATDD